MKNGTEPEWHRWLRQAEEDLKYARYLHRDGGHYLACYLSQQVAEKALKAFLYFSGEEVVLGHSVARLAERASSLRTDFASIAADCSILDSYYIPTRYPNGLPDGIAPDVYNAEAAAQALVLAGRVVSTVRMAAGLDP